MFRSSGDPEAAFPLFQDAFARAVEAGEHFLAGDAAHMCAISVDDRNVMEDWTQRGLDLGEREPDAAYWAGPLLNNLAWAYHEDGDHEQALGLFRRALEARERDSDNEAAMAFARYGLQWPWNAAKIAVDRQAAGQNASRRMNVRSSRPRKTSSSITGAATTSKISNAVIVAAEVLYK